MDDMEIKPIQTPNSGLRLNQTYLIVDTRERAVIPFIDDEVTKYVYVQRQINTGDYLICRTLGAETKILACIERKTYVDFAASFSDGRYDNIKKMCQLRQATGCQLYFFIEGPAFPSLNRKFSRISYVNILSAITKIMVRNNIFVVNTENENHTAQRLNNFLKAFDDTYSERDPTDFAPFENVTHAEGIPAEDTKGGGQPDDPVQYADILVPDMLTTRIEQSIGTQSTIMWSRLKGISIVVGKLITLQFSVAELMDGKLAVNQIRELKTATGRVINKDAVTSLCSLQSDNLELATKLMSGIRSITPVVASHMIRSAGGFAKLCKMSANDISQLTIPQKNRTVRIGMAKAERVVQMLQFKELPNPDS